MEFSPHHIAISSSNLDITTAFYNYFGFKEILTYSEPSGEFRIRHMRLDSLVLEIFAYRRNAELPPHATKLATDLPRIGVKHFGLRVKSLPDARLHLENLNVEFATANTRGKTEIDYFFVKDPDGILVEVVQDDRGI